MKLFQLKGLTSEMTETKMSKRKDVEEERCRRGKMSKRKDLEEGKRRRNFLLRILKI